MRPTRHFGTKKQSVASKRASAMQYLVLAPNPELAKLMGPFGLSRAEAQRMLDDELARRAGGSASTELRGLFG